MYARIRDAFAPLAADGVVFIVLTIDRDGFFSGKAWPDATAVYRALSRMQNKLMKRHDRLFVRRGWTPIGNRWVAPVEAHAGGMPHLNVMLYAPDWARELEQNRLAQLATGATKREAMLLGGDALRHAVESGWGKQSTAERCRSVGKLNNYITKIAGNADRTVGEIAKLTQLPLNAPKRFHRLRSGKGFLPPRNKNLDWTGTVVRHVADPQRAAFAAEPMVRHRDAEIPMRCAEIEERRIHRAELGPRNEWPDFNTLSKLGVVGLRATKRRDGCETYDLATGQLVGVTAADSDTLPFELTLPPDPAAQAPAGNLNLGRGNAHPPPRESTVDSNAVAPTRKRKAAK